MAHYVIAQRIISLDKTLRGHIASVRPGILDIIWDAFPNELASVHPDDVMPEDSSTDPAEPTP